VIPLEDLPGAAQWRGSLPALLAHPGPLWVYGGPGTGVSTVSSWLAEQRAGGWLDDAERLAPEAVAAWLADHPEGVLGAHLDPEAGAAAGRCLPFRLQELHEDPDSAARCLAAMARADGSAGPPPPALAALPCPGNLHGLHNRLVRWRLLGQLPDDAPALGGPALPLETEDLAANLHVLERILLHRALRRSYGNRVEAARRLGVSRRQLYLLIDRHGDPVRGQTPNSEGPKRLRKRNSRFPTPSR